jgi:hypothetical protein
MHSRELTQVLLTLMLCAGCQRLPSPPPPAPHAAKAPERLLFVGNSFTYYNGGLENHVKQLAESATPPRRLTADRATQGGATLKILYGLNRVHDKMRAGRYDLVILQEDIPELTEHSVAPFFEQARLFDREIRELGSKTVLFMAWPYERLKWVTQAQIAQAHRAIGQELGVPVAPVGTAFERALKERPKLAMLGRDQEHESIHGTYLAANVIYATIFAQSPQGLPYRPAGVSAEEAGFLQAVAWATVQEWQRQQ